MNTTIFRLGAAALAASTILLVSACGDDAENGPATPAPDAPAATEATNAAGASKALVDGKALDGNFETTCVKEGGTLALALTDLANTTYGQLSVSAGIADETTVQAVAIAGTQGGDNGLPYAIGYGSGQPGGSAEVTKDGDTYTVTGEGIGTPDMADPMAAPKSTKFEITFACSDIVG